MMDVVYRWERTFHSYDEDDDDYYVTGEELLYSSPEWIDKKVDEADWCWHADIEENLLDYEIDYYNDDRTSWTHEEMFYISLKPAIEDATDEEYEALEECEDCDMRNFPYEETPEGTVVEFGYDTKAKLNIDTMEWVRD